MNGLKENQSKYESIDKRLENNCNNYFWYSQTYTPLNSYQYFNRNSSQQLLESAVHKWTLGSNQSIVTPDLTPFQPNNGSQQSLKRSYYHLSNASEDYEPRKRSRSWESYPSDLKRRYRDTNGVQSSFECYSCGSFSYSFHDFKQHLKGKRHAMHLRSLNRSHTSVNHSLQRKLDQTNEPVVGLDFIKEVEDKFSDGTNFDCKLCNCHNLKQSSAYQHILGFKHRYNYIKFIDSDEAKAFAESGNNHEDSVIARSLAKKLEMLYGRGDCKFIKNTKHRKLSSVRELKRRHTDLSDSSNECAEKDPNMRHKSVSDSESPTNCSVANELIDRAIETLKAIRLLCDKALKSYAIKQNLSAYSSTEANNIGAKNAVNQLIGKVDGIRDNKSLGSGLILTAISSGVGPVINSQTELNEWLNVKREAYKDQNRSKDSAQ